MIFSLRILSLASALAAILAAAPVAPPNPSTVDRAQERYSIYLDSGVTYTFDGNGGIVQPEQQYDTLKDLLTGEAKYKQYTRTEDTGKDYEGGSPILRTLCALYDMNDKLIYDWSEYGYGSAIGDFVVKKDSRLLRSMIGPAVGDYCVLWNVKTNKEFMNNVERVERIDDSAVLLYRPDYNDAPLGVLEFGSGQPVFSPFPTGYSHTQVWDKMGQLVADLPVLQDQKKASKQVVMTKDYKVLLEGKRLNVSYVALRGPFIAFTDDEETGILSAEGKLLYKLPPQCENYNYFDGELVALSMLKEENGQRIWTRQLAKVDGTALTEVYDRLEPRYDDEYGDDAPATGFLGTRGETIDILDRTGKVTATRTIPRLRGWTYLGDGFSGYSVRPEGVGPEVAEDDSRLICGVLNEKLETVIAPDKYSTVAREYGRKADGTRGQVSLLSGQRKTANGLARTDIMDMEGKLLIENLTTSGEIGPDRIAVVKGFSVGVMDWQGNWIGKHSIFNGFEDERKKVF